MVRTAFADRVVRNAICLFWGRERGVDGDIYSDFHAAYDAVQAALNSPYFQISDALIKLLDLDTHGDFIASSGEDRKIGEEALLQVAKEYVRRQMIEKDWRVVGELERRAALE